MSSTDWSLLGVNLTHAAAGALGWPPAGIEGRR